MPMRSMLATAQLWSFILQIDKSFLFGHSSDIVEVVGASEQRSGPPAFAKLRLAADNNEEEDVNN